MEASITRLLIAVSLITSASLGLSGCASAPKPGAGAEPPAPILGPVVLPPQTPGGGPASEPMGPPAPVAADQPTGTYGPEPVSIRKVVLVLGPGLARGYAHVGVIRALNEAKIQVAAIVGTEMGAFVGSIYGMEAKINRFEFALLRFKDDMFVAQRGLLPGFFSKAGKTKRFEAELERVFEKKDLNQSKLPLKVLASPKGSDKAVAIERGSAAGAVRAAMADLGLFEPAKWEGEEMQSAALERPFAISEARDLNLGPVVAVDTSGGGGDLKDADLVIRPDLAGIGPLDFNKRTDAVFRGKKAVMKQLPELRQLVGLPSAPDAIDPQKEAAR